MKITFKKKYLASPKFLVDLQTLNFAERLVFLFFSNSRAYTMIYLSFICDKPNLFANFVSEEISALKERADNFVHEL